MKKIIILIVVVLIYSSAYSQKITGKVKNAENETLAGANVILLNTKNVAQTDKNGNFVFGNLKPGEYTIKISYTGYETLSKIIKLSNENRKIQFTLNYDDILTDEILISANRAGANTPIAYTNIDKSEIQKRNTGQDIPYVLKLTPSVVVTSDAGAGIGYTGFRVRGTDMTRINITADGIPLNDSESHGVWWVNMPDFASGVDNIQIQRGVGTSTNGAAAFGANVNFRTNKIKKKAYGEIGWTAGSFNTQKATYKLGTGLLKKHFVFDARLSKIHSDGYIDRANTDLQSYQISATYTDKKNLFKVNVIKGKEHTYQAWGGVPKDSLEINRTYNPYTYDNETDNYEQTHYQMFYTREFNKNFYLNIALHDTKGEGYYEQFKESRKFSDYNLDDVIIGDDTITRTDLIQRKWLDNRFVGAIYSLKYSSNNLSATLGGAWNKYKGDHFGRIIWTKYASNGNIRHQWYLNSGDKTDLNEYLKVNYSFAEKFNFWADMQFRTILYDIEGNHDDLTDITQTHEFNFFNPKAGLSYKINDNSLAYFSFAEANREPSRSDYKDADENNKPQPEKLFDYEAGYKYSNPFLSINLNFYYMDYKNQLVNTGKINNVGAPVMINVDKSYRAGIEFQGGIKIFDLALWNFNITLSQNKIQNFTEYVDNWVTWSQESKELGTTDIAFSPNVIAGNEISYDFFRFFNFNSSLNLSLISKYVGKQYIDNSSNENRILDPYFVNDIKLSYSFKTKYVKQVEINFILNNVLNEQYETSAWVYSYLDKDNNGNLKEYSMDGYFPQAGINFLMSLNLRF